MNLNIPFNMSGKFLSSHDHHTTMLKTPYDNKICGFCGLTSLVVYFCEECRLRMCKNCFKLRREISHPLHPHPLRMSNRNTTRCICDGCTHFLQNCVCYQCEHCEFYLCVECGNSKTSKRPLLQENKKLLHYSHHHELTTCRFRDEVEMPRCRVCDHGMCGVGYACVRCWHFVHEYCMGTPRVVQYPFHPQHLLQRRNYKTTGLAIGICNVCKDPQNVAGFDCYRCKFYVHSRCAIAQLRAIELGCHRHSLMCFPAMFLNQFTRRECPICNEHFATDREYSFFRCVECDLNFHFNCVSIPQSFKHKYHQHTLFLKDPSIDYAAKMHYCDVCEARRNPKCYAYYCQQCNFFSHVECVLSKEEDYSRVFSTMMLEQHSEVEQPKHPIHSNQKQILFPCHVHPLSLQNDTRELCRMCMLEINGTAYTCNQCDGYWVHEQCAHLPEELRHSLHPNHKLSFLPQFQGKYFMCNLCRKIIREFIYSCRTCEFSIDVKCVLSIESREVSNNEDTKNSLRHIVHDHELTLGHVGKDTGLNLPCEICGENCLDLTYCCLQCSFFVHKACLDWPSLIESHPLHPEHKLRLTCSMYRGNCYACDGFISALWYECETHWFQAHPSCGIFFHLECGVSLGRLLRQKHHDHHLYYLHKQPHKGHFSIHRQACSLCQQATEVSYYRCHTCKLHFHLRCLQLPQAAKHKWHLHWLVFKDLFDYGGYYCDICEEPRDFLHPVYYCEECNVVVHVECIVSPENASNVTIEEIESENINMPECFPASSDSAATSD